MNLLVDIRDLSVGYTKEPVIENANLQVCMNDFIGMIGPNGGGKTTLLKAILGLLKPLKGEVRFSDELDGKKKRIGYLPQIKHIDRKFPITVFDVVMSGSLTLSGLHSSPEEKKDRTFQLLEEMNIAGIKNKAIGELSGGQMQRVFLCRALFSHPLLLILDEPDSFVDNRFEGELYEMLKKINDGMAILLVSHDLRTISRYIKSIAHVNHYLHFHPSNELPAGLLETWCHFDPLTIEPVKIQQ
jgi:zinc transport system ATP-binding protein